jgi:hypothetical protein
MAAEFMVCLKISKVPLNLYTERSTECPSSCLFSSEDQALPSSKFIFFLSKSPNKTMLIKLFDDQILKLNHGIEKLGPI